MKIILRRICVGRLGLSAALFFLIEFSALATPPTGYYLVWSDEFNGSSLDTSKWALRLPGVYRDAFNSLNAVSFNGSNLVITTYTQNGTNFSAMLYAKGKFESKFGYWESNIKWADSNAEWSSPWLLSRGYSLNTSQLAAAPDNDDPQTFGAEIDICEHRYVSSANQNIAGYVQSNIHWKKGTANVDDPGSPLVPSSGGLASGFHTYGFLWTPTNYSFRVDDVQTYSNRTTTPVVHAAEYPLLTSCVDDTLTTWAGHIPAGGYGSVVTSATKFSVDYVRYYAPTNDLFWTGASSAYWNNSANWLSNFFPTANCDLTFARMSGNRSMTLGQDFNIAGLIFLDAAGTFSINGANTLTLGADGIDMISADNNVTLNAPVTIAANQTWNIGPNDPNGNLTLTDNGNLSGSATLTLTGYGIFILKGANNFSGTLKIAGDILSGTGAIAGDATIQSGGKLSPGASAANSIGALSFGNLTLASGSTTILEISAAAQTNDALNATGTLTCGGSLIVTNLAGTLAAGQSFKLFNAATLAGNFSALTLPPLNAGLAWNTNNLNGGILSVIAVSPAESLMITNSSTGGEAQLNWKYGTLQIATNVLGPYSDVPDATSPYAVAMTNTQQFYRIREN